MEGKQPPYPIDVRREVRVTRVHEAFPESGFAEPGAVFIDTEGLFKDSLLFACPGCGDWRSIGAQHPKPVHAWDIVKGSLLEPETLTLSPSIWCKCCCGWHGHLEDGLFHTKKA